MNALMCMAVSGWTASRPEPSPLVGGVRSVRMLHIPKTAGISLINQLKRERVDVPNMEWCFNRFTKLQKMHRSERAKVFALTFLREPRAHVLSQYVMCRYAPREVHNRKEYAKSHPDSAKFPANGTVSAEFAKWVSNFARGWTLARGSWSCYLPRDMQTRALTCHASSPSHDLAKKENPPRELAIKRAKENLGRMNFTGVVEWYDESFCALHWNLFHSFSRMNPWDCQCNETHRATARPVRRVTHELPRHSLREVAPATLREVDSITRSDREVYGHARALLHAQLLRVERESGRRLVCGATPPLLNS